MSDDLVSFKMLVVSEADAERDALRRAAADAAFHIEFAEIADPSDPLAVCDLVSRDALDLVFLDSRLSRFHRQSLHDVAQTTPSRPLVIFVGPADSKTREVWCDSASASANAVLAKPIKHEEAVAVINACARARLTKRVLVVDDSSTVRSVIRKVLQTSRFRFDVAEASDGPTAVEESGRRHFDIVFLDCNMPGLDGFATLEALKAAHPGIQVVMITGTRDARIEDRARAAGASDFLFKPFYAKDVDAILHRLSGLIAPKVIVGGG